jgi:ribosomal protein S27AE
MPFAVVELRSQDINAPRVLSLDYTTDPPSASLGRAVTLDELAMTGLRAESGKEEKGRQFGCPNCGSWVVAELAQSKSVTCGHCHTLFDLTSGVGAELRQAQQDEPVASLIPLGRIGQLQGADWQVVGFQHRMGTEPDDPDEHFGWSEYLLYNAKKGFCFLVDAEDGWSLVRPITGAPAVKSNTATYQGKAYTLQYRYTAETTYVLGEFYWQVQRGQKTFNEDYAAGTSLLSMEKTPTEVTWSAGNKLAADTVAKAFRLEASKEQFQRADAAPVSTASGTSLRTIIILVLILIVVLFLLSRCSRCDPAVENCSSSSSRSSGGSFGGFSSGGGHK